MVVTAPGTSATEAEADVDRVVEAYALRDPEAAVGFVRAHPGVVPLLIEAVAVVPRYFGPGRLLVLEVERDRDAHDHTLLFALIQTDQDVDDALAGLDRFGEEWWLEALPQAGARLVFGLEYA